VPRAVLSQYGGGEPLTGTLNSAGCVRKDDRHARRRRRVKESHGSFNGFHQLPYMLCCAFVAFGAINHALARCLVLSGRCGLSWRLGLQSTPIVVLLSDRPLKHQRGHALHQQHAFKHVIKHSKQQSSQLPNQL
jgi:hypothetical protein